MKDLLSISRPDEETVRTLIRQGRIEAALGEVHGGTATERQLTEELRTYQAELVLQNDQLRAAEQAAAAALEHFRSLFLLHPEPVLQLDAKGQIVECNEAAARLFGIGSLDGVHLFFSQRVAPAYRGMVLRALSDACRGGQQQIAQVALITAQGETRECWDLRLCGVPGENSGLPQCVAVLIDQSRLLLRQDELQKRVDEQSRRLGEVHAQAMAASASHAQVAMRLVGELQQPLGRVTRYARSLRDGMPPADADGGPMRAQLDGIIEATNSMLRIVAELGQAVQAESGQLVPRLVRCDVGYLLREAVHAERGAAPAGVALQAMGSTEPLHANADPGLLEHVARALLRKSAQQAEPGTTVRIEWAARAADDQAPHRVEVGIVRRGARRAPAELARMFSLFTPPGAASESHAKDHLAMLGVRVMVELHGGRVWGVNVEDGIAIRFWIPIAA